MVFGGGIRYNRLGDSMDNIIYYLGIDIGASGGRHILGSVQDGRLVLEEIHRFENGIHYEDGTAVWDIAHLCAEVTAGIAKCRTIGKIPATVAIDTWGVDYVLLDENRQEILPAVSYRDGRTESAVAAVAAIIPPEELYARTGIQQQPYNTIYQLYCDKQSGKLARAAHLLMMPEYLSYKLTGVIKNEYTNATTTNLVNAATRQWDDTVIDALGLPRGIFGEISAPCTAVGGFCDEVREYVGFDATVVLCPSHDTASAVAACPLPDDGMYISSGTWSLVGTENRMPVTTDAARQANFTNEGGVEYRYRFLKNIMGMWLFQSIRRADGSRYTYDEMMQMAMASDYTRLIDPTDAAFLAPENMIEAIRASLGDPQLPLADVLSCVYHSLATSYRRVTEEIERVSGKTVGSITIVGGGSKDAYLNRLTAQYTGKTVRVGLTEGTATGNIISQIMYREGLSLAACREMINKTFDMREVAR